MGNIGSGGPYGCLLIVVTFSALLVGLYVRTAAIAQTIPSNRVATITSQGRLRLM